MRHRMLHARRLTLNASRIRHSTFDIRRFLPLLLLLSLACPSGSGREVEVSIPPGLSTSAIGDTLKAYGVIDNTVKFRFLARALGFDRRLRYGRYTFNRNTEELTVLRALTEQGRTSTLITVPEGYRLTQIAELLEENGICDVPGFMAACRDRVLLSGLNVPHGSAEGYLFPDTYDFELDSDPADIVRRMARRFFKVYDNLKQNADPPLDDTETVILASIVEREAILPGEFPAIAGVFLNRLRRGHRLQSCATVQYVLPQYRTKLTIKDTKTDSPYNTYIHQGLPPGPISSPGRRALRAALKPARTEYLFFVANGDGSHTFSRTSREHEAARRRIRRGG